MLAVILATFPLLSSAGRPVILVLGDSLSAGYGIALEKGWVSLLRERLEALQHDYRVVNASISGDTTRGGLARIEDILRMYRPAILVLELGGNDGLRGVPLDETRRNLTAIVERSHGAGVEVLLVGIQLPPNYGPVYTRRFKEMYPALSERHRLALVPFLLDGVATNPALMQADGIHPREEAQTKVFDNVGLHLEPML